MEAFDKRVFDTVGSNRVGTNYADENSRMTGFSARDGDYRARPASRGREPWWTAAA